MMAILTGETGRYEEDGVRGQETTSKSWGKVTLGRLVAGWGWICTTTV